MGWGGEGLCFPGGEVSGDGIITRCLALLTSSAPLNLKPAAAQYGVSSKSFFFYFFFYLGASDAFYHSSLWMSLELNSQIGKGRWEGGGKKQKSFKKCLSSQMASSVLITQLTNRAW